MSATPDDIIAQAARMFYRTEGAGQVGTIAVANLTAAGYRIVGPDELDPATIERCQAEVEDACEAGHSDHDVIRFIRKRLRSLKKEGSGG